MKRPVEHADNCNDYIREHNAQHCAQNRVLLYMVQLEEPIEQQPQTVKDACDKKGSRPLLQQPLDAHAPHHQDITHEIWHRSGCQKSLLLLWARTPITSQ